VPKKEKPAPRKDEHFHTKKRPGHGQEHSKLEKYMAAQVNSTEDPVAAVRRYIDAFNKGDAKAMSGWFTVPGSILDGMAHHVWQSPTAAEDWYRDVLKEAEHHGASDY